MQAVKPKPSIIYYGRRSNIFHQRNQIVTADLYDQNEKEKHNEPLKINLKLDKALFNHGESPKEKPKRNIFNRSSVKYHTYEKLIPENEGNYERELKGYLNKRKEALQNFYGAEENGGA